MFALNGGSSASRAAAAGFSTSSDGMWNAWGMTGIRANLGQPYSSASLHSAAEPQHWLMAQREPQGHLCEVGVSPENSSL